VRIPAHAQITLKKKISDVKNKVNTRVENKIDKTVNNGLNAVEESLTSIQFVRLWSWLFKKDRMIKQSGLLLSLVFWMSVSNAQSLTFERIGTFMTSGSLKVISIQADTVLELAHSVELFPYPMAWIPGKDFKYSAKGLFQLTASYAQTQDQEFLYIVLMIPGAKEDALFLCRRILFELPLFVPHISGEVFHYKWYTG
jgi:hypothetical protein